MPSGDKRVDPWTDLEWCEVADRGAFVTLERVVVVPGQLDLLAKPTRREVAVEYWATWESRDA